MKTLGEELEDWRQHITDYLTAQTELFKLRLVDKLTVLFASMLTRLIVITFLILSLMMASVAFAIWLGEVIDSLSLGFLCVSALYLVLLIIILLLRQPLIEKPVIKCLLNFIFENPIDDDNN